MHEQPFMNPLQAGQHHTNQHSELHHSERHHTEEHHTGFLPGHFAREFDRRYPELYHRLMPALERIHRSHHDISQMSRAQLHHLADQAMHESGVLHQLPHGHTADTVRDMASVLLLGLEESRGGSVEAFSPLLPIALGPWFWPWGFDEPFFPHHRRHPGHRWNGGPGFHGGHGGPGFHGGPRGRR